jgi:hypothetical protein
MQCALFSTLLISVANHEFLVAFLAPNVKCSVVVISGMQMKFLASRMVMLISSGQWLFEIAPSKSIATKTTSKSLLCARPEFAR